MENESGEIVDYERDVHLTLFLISLQAAATILSILLPSFALFPKTPVRDVLLETRTRLVSDSFKV